MERVIRTTPSGAVRIIGNALRSHTDAAQTTEIAIAVEVLNRMLDPGRPKSVRVA